MLPKVIIHNSISLDGSLTNFDVNMGLHYQIAGNYKPEVHLIGSNTVKVGIELFGGEVPPEEDKDFQKPNRDQALPYWVILDTRGILKGVLHTCRSFEFCKDVVVLVSKTTPQEYITHLEERNYDHHVVGDDHVDLEKALQLLADKYNVKTVLTDAGSTLTNFLLDQDLVHEISLLLTPVIVGKDSENMFGNLKRKIQFKDVKCEALDDNHIWLVYKIKD